MFKNWKATITTITFGKKFSWGRKFTISDNKKHNNMLLSGQSCNKI